jgi:Bacterial Ig-like domain
MSQENSSGASASSFSIGVSLPPVRGNLSPTGSISDRGNVEFARTVGQSPSREPDNGAIRESDLVAISPGIGLSSPGVQRAAEPLLSSGARSPDAASHHHPHVHPTSNAAPFIAGISDSVRTRSNQSGTVVTIKSPAPTLIGFGHAGDVISVFDGKTRIGSTTVHADGTWAFSTSALLKGHHDFLVSAVDSTNGAVLMSQHLVVNLVAGSVPQPSAIATITSAIDEFADPVGNHHDNLVQNGGRTAYTSPQLHGTISAALHADEVLAIYRDGRKIGTASVTGLGWSYEDDGLATGEHVYMARVESASGGQGTPGRRISSSTKQPEPVSAPFRCSQRKTS